MGSPLHTETSVGPIRIHSYRGTLLLKSVHRPALEIGSVHNSHCWSPRILDTCVAGRHDMLAPAVLQGASLGTRRRVARADPHPLHTYLVWLIRYVPVVILARDAAYECAVRVGRGAQRQLIPPRPRPAPVEGGQSKRAGQTACQRRSLDSKRVLSSERMTVRATSLGARPSRCSKPGQCMTAGALQCRRPWGRHLVERLQVLGQAAKPLGKLAPSAAKPFGAGGNREPAASL
eukprot:366571-Chlamydomonas_euryale.AAC.34